MNAHNPNGCCKFAGIQPSMGSRRDRYDNAMCESSDAMLECEIVGIRKKKPVPEAVLLDYEEIKSAV